MTFDSKYGELPTPSRTGHSFKGWYTEENGGTKVDKDTIVKTAGNHTLYAKWGVDSYTVTFNANGGTVSPAKKNVTYNETYGDLPTPSRTGYDFTGWYTNKNGGDLITSGTQVTITANQTLYARWSAKSFTVTLDKNGGDTEADPSSVSVTYDKTYADLPSAGNGAPEKRGHSFTGWFTAAEGGTRVNKTDTVKITKNTRLYAHWSANSYTLKLDKADSRAQLSKTSMTVTYGESYTLPIPTLTGYDFLGWYDGETKIGNNRLTVDFIATKTVKARWKAKNYKVSFDVNGGREMAAGYITVSFDGTYAAISSVGTPLKTGYSFTGWYDRDEGGTRIKEDTRVTRAEDHTLYAHWSPNKYMLTLSANGEDANCELTELEVTYDGDYSALPAPWWTDRVFTFIGWYTSPEDGKGELIRNPDTVKITRDTTLYAHWTKTIFVRGINLDKSEMVIKTKEYGQLTASIVPENATDKSVTWKTDNPEVATVDAGGRVSGIKPGQAVITVTATDPGETNDKVFSARCRVTVEPGNMEDFPDTAGGTVTICWDSKSNTYTTLDGKNVLVISREDGIPTDPPVYVFNGKRFRPGKGSYVIYHGIAYRYWHDYKMAYRRNRKAGTAKAIVRWRKKISYYKSGEKKTVKEMIILKRTVSDNSAVTVETWLKGRRILRVFVAGDGRKIRASRYDYSYVRTPEAFVITFKRNFEGTVSVNRTRRKKRV